VKIGFAAFVAAQISQAQIEGTFLCLQRAEFLLLEE
jgi:hypothetical protein